MSWPLYSGDAFVLQNAHYYATILGLPFRCLVVTDLVTLPHGARRQHSSEGNVSLLNQDIGKVIGAVFAELLV